jgi:transposase
VDRRSGGGASSVRLFHDVPMVYLHREPVDFRKAINGLVLVIEHDMSLSPYAQALFVFTNRSRDKLKIVWWDETGFCLWYKRLEQARFAWPKKATEPVLELSQSELNWLLQGFDILRMVPHQRLNYGV